MFSCLKPGLFPPAISLQPTREHAAVTQNLPHPIKNEIWVQMGGVGERRQTRQCAGAIFLFEQESRQFKAASSRSVKRWKPLKESRYWSGGSSFILFIL